MSNRYCGVCSIYLDSCRTDYFGVILECGHEFHTYCITKYFQGNPKKCPLCEKEKHKSDDSDSDDSQVDSDSDDSQVDSDDSESSEDQNWLSSATFTFSPYA